jgi:hypothetical protein
MKPDILIQRRPRRTLALKATPRGLIASIPCNLDPDSPHVLRFIEAGLGKLNQTSEVSETSEVFTHVDLRARVDEWSECLGVTVHRVQVRPMRNKWASCSSNGILTLNLDLLHLPLDLVDYVLCHDLLHLKISNHGKAFRAMMGCHLPDWRDREMRLAGWIMDH